MFDIEAQAIVNFQFCKWALGLVVATSFIADTITNDFFPD
jgi:hypothetical protein